MNIIIRPATAADHEGIVSLVRGERLNPNDLDWRRFVVAVSDGGLIGAAQIRRHRYGVGELASLVVSKGWRRKGVAAGMIAALLKKERGPLYVITSVGREGYFGRWGFGRVRLRQSPLAVQFNFIAGTLIGGAHALLTRRARNRLAVFHRPSVAADARSYPDNFGPLRQRARRRS